MKRGYLKPSFNIFLLRCARASYLLGLYEFVEYFDHEFMSTRRYNDIFEEILGQVAWGKLFSICIQASIWKKELKYVIMQIMKNLIYELTFLKVICWWSFNFKIQGCKKGSSQNVWKCSIKLPAKNPIYHLIFTKPGKSPLSAAQ